MERKTFIRTCSGLCLAGLANSLLLESCASANYFAKHTEETKKITVAKTEFNGKRGGKEFTRDYVLVAAENQQVPICLYRHSDADYAALLMLCTHQGCELTVSGHMLSCPCHGSEFDNHGVVQNPPADKNLTTYSTSTDNENIYIYIA